MTPRNEKIALVVALLISSSAAWNFWVGAPQFVAMANEWSVDIPAYVKPFFQYHKAFVLLPVLVIGAWLLPQTHKHRGWICLCIALLSVVFQASLWVPVFAAPTATG